MNLHEKSVNKAIKYIEENLTEELTLEEVSKEVAYSPYHFSRIFKQFTGENILSMIKRLRLAQSTRELLHKDSNITEVGLNVGYETSSSFNKAFKQTFQCSPSLYKKKIEENLINYRKSLKNEPRIINIEKEITLIYTRSIGEYAESAFKSWDELINLSHKNSITFEDKKYFGLCFDDPTITDYEKMRYEACLTIQNINLPKNFDIKTIPKGKYVVLKHLGDYEELYDVWLQFYGWVLEKDLKLTNFPPFEEYLNNPKDVLEGNINSFETNLYLNLDS